MNEPSKICTICRTERFLSDYHKKKGGKFGLDSRCKFCRRDDAKRRPKKPYDRATDRISRLKYYYGITPEQYAALWESQDQCCGICHSLISGGRNWALDHDHATKKIRGILCHYCNMTLGNCKENISRLENCIEYLRKHGSGTPYTRPEENNGRPTLDSLRREQ